MCVNSVSYSYAGKLTVAEVGEWSWSVTRGVGYQGWVAREVFLV